MIAVHCGVGKHDEDLDKLCKEAIIKADGDVVKAVMVLEEDYRTNCGFGSSLTNCGKVETEGSYMSSHGLLFGAVGALSVSPHPSLLAKHIALNQLSGDNDLVRPLVIVGKGADEYAIEMGLPCFSNESMISDNSEVNRKRARLILDRMDTVGAVSIKKDGTCQATLSSGGILLKKRGRLGHSTVFGAGIWAEQRDNISVSIALSGCGEVLIRTRLAEKLAEDLFNNIDNLPLQIIQNCIRYNFVDSRLVSSFLMDHRKVGGLIAVAKGEQTELVAFHNTHNFPIAFFDNQRVRRKVLGRSSQDNEFVFESFLF